MITSCLNTIQNYTQGYVVGKPSMWIDYNQGIAGVSASCNAKDNSNCTLMYTLDGSKPSLDNSIPYKLGEVIEIEQVTPVLFKAFIDGLIESPTVGRIVDPF